jgi:tetratricopeptide (TPR) repeat protein
LEGNYSAAEPILKAVASEQELYATSKSDRMNTLIDLSGTQIFLGHYKDSDATNERLVALCKDEPGDTPQLGDALQNLGESAEVQGRYDQAEQYERKSIRLASSWYGIDHRITANKMSSLAATLIDEKKDDEAATVLRKVMAIEERTYPPDSIYRAKTLKSVGMLQLATGHSEAALISFDRVLAIMRSHYTDDNYLIARTYIFQGMAYQQMRDDAHAEELFRKGLQMLQRVRGETDVYTALAHLKLGHTLLTQNRYNEAETQLHAACATYKALSMEQTNLMREALKDLVAVEDARHSS